MWEGLREGALHRLVSLVNMVPFCVRSSPALTSFEFPPSHCLQRSAVMKFACTVERFAVLRVAPSVEVRTLYRADSVDLSNDVEEGRRGDAFDETSFPIFSPLTESFNCISK